VNTVLVLTADEAIRTRVARSLSKFSIFEARSEGEAFQTLRLVDIDVVLREGKGPTGALASFMAAGFVAICQGKGNGPKKGSVK